jgi:hypothetical protein
MNKYSKNYVSAILAAPEVTDDLLISTRASEEEKLFKTRLSLVSVFNIRTEAEYLDWVQFGYLLEQAALIAELLPVHTVNSRGQSCQNVRGTSGKELAIPNLQIALYTVIWGLLRERTSAQVAAMFSGYEAGTQIADALQTTVANLISVAHQCGLITLRPADNIRGERWLLNRVHELEEMAQKEVLYSGVVLNAGAKIINDTLIIPATATTDYFEAPVKPGSTLSDWYIMPTANTDITKRLEQWEIQHRTTVAAMEADLLAKDKDPETSVELAILKQHRPPYDLQEVVRYSNKVFCVVMNHDSRGRETAASAVGQFMDSSVRELLTFAEYPTKNLHHLDGTALCLALSAFILGWTLPHEAVELNLTSEYRDPYAAPLQKLGQDLISAIKNFYLLSLEEAQAEDSLRGTDSASYWLAFANDKKGSPEYNYLREVVKKGITPISYGSGVATAVNAIVENTQLPEMLATRVVKVVRGYAPLRAYLKAIQKGTNLNSAYSYQFNFEYDGEQYTLAASLDNRYQGDIFQEGRTPVHYSHGLNNEKARIASPANFNQHLESVLLAGMRLVAARKAEQSKDISEWLVFATHDSIGTPNENNTQYLCSAVPYIANAWAQVAQPGLMKHFGIQLLPRNTWLALDGHLYIE